MPELVRDLLERDGARLQALVLPARTSGSAAARNARGAISR